MTLTNQLLQNAAVASNEKLVQSFCRLMAYHKAQCSKPHRLDYIITGVDVWNERFECTCCGAKEDFAVKIPDLEEGHGNEWACAILTQGEAFAEKHKHVQ